MKRLLWPTISVLTLALGPVSALARAPVDASRNAGSTLQVCTNIVNGKALTGDIDLMLVMDNSKSLQKNDPQGERFGQVEMMLKAVHDRVSKSRKPRAVRFSLIAFAERATVVIPRAGAVVLSDSNIKGVVERVQMAAPGDLQNTNYVNAIDVALDEMAGAAPQNCRVIVWFTDGAYWPASLADGRGDTATGGTLRDSVCRSGGFSERLRQANINLFPLYIEAQSPDLQNEDPTASRDVMAHLTGHETAFGEDPYRAGAPCSSLPSTQVGEVLAASDVTQLANFFADLPNIIEGGVAVACPTNGGRVESKPLPAGRYVAQISIVKYAEDGKELTPSDLVARTPDGSTQPLEQFFSGTDGRYQATSAARLLPTGWKIEGSGAEHCIRAFARDGLAVQIRKEGGISLRPIGPSKEWLDGEDLISSDQDEVAPVVRLGTNAKCDPLAGFTTDPDGLQQMFETLTGRGNGVICVDAPGSDVFPLGISVSVSREGEPFVQCEEITLRRDGVDEFVSSDRTEVSTVCEIDFEESGTQFVRVQKNFSTGLLSRGEITTCNIDSSRSQVRSSQESGVVAFSLAVVLKENSATKCNLEGEKLLIEYRDTEAKTKVVEVPVRIKLDLQAEPDRPLALIATLLTVLALLAAALVVLRRMTTAAAALLPPSQLWAVRLGGEATRSSEGRTTLTINGKPPRELRLNMEMLERASIQGDSGRMTLVEGSDTVNLIREMPPLTRLLAEPWVYINDPRPKAVHPKARRSARDQSLEAPFREVVMVFDDGPDEGRTRVRRLSLWAIRTRGSATGDQAAIEELLDAHSMPLVDELLDQVLTGQEVAHGDLAGGVSSTPLPPTESGSDYDRSVIPEPPDWS